MRHIVIPLTALIALGCAGDLTDPGALGYASGPLTEEELNQAVLDMLNHETTTFQVLDIDAGLTSTAADSLIAHRDGLDGILGTEDDDLFDSITEVDNVKYVGASALGLIKAFAETWTPPDPNAPPVVEEVDALDAQVLAMLNHETTDLKVLDIDAALTSTAAKNLLAHRDGGDATFGTGDDDLFDHMLEVDDVSGVGGSALSKLYAFAATWTPPDPNMMFVVDEAEQKVVDMLNHTTTTLTILDVNAGLSATAAKKLIAHRNGLDGMLGTEDDDLFDDLQEVDDVKYVGDAAMALIIKYAATWTPEQNEPGGPVDLPQVALFLNHVTTTLKILIDEVGLTTTQANNVIAFRDGPDGEPGTNDDNLFDSVKELDSVKYIGPATIAKIQDYSAAWEPLDPAVVLLAKVLAFLNSPFTTLETLDVDAGLTKTAAANLIAHRNGADGQLGTEDDDLFDDLEEVDAVSYVGTSALAQIKAFAEAWDPESAEQASIEAAKDQPLSCSHCGIFAGLNTEYDPGPPVGSGWAELFAEVPNFRKVAQALGAQWLEVDPLTGKSKLDLENEALVAAGEDPIASFTLTKDKFRYHMGPLFYRGRLDGSARVLVVGQEGATDEALVHRAFTGGTGQKVQNFLNAIGITHSYIMVNTFVYSIFEQYDAFTAELAMSGPIKDHRSKIFAKIFAENNIELVLTFGNAAYNSMKTFRNEQLGGKWPPGVRWSHMVHPGAAALSFAPGNTGEVIDSGTLGAVISSMSASWKRVWYWRYIDPGWLDTDPDAWTFQSSKFYFGDRDIPYRDLPYGTSPQIGRGGTKSERAKSGLQVQLRSSNGVRYEAPEMDYPATPTKADSGYHQDLPTEVSWEPHKFQAERHDPGPSPDWVQLFFGTPPQVVIEDESQVDANNDFHQVPLWYRGRINSQLTRVLVIAQDYGTDQVVAGRTLVGETGQKINHFLANIGTGSDYVMLSPYPYPVSDTVADYDVLNLSQSPSLAAHRDAIISKLLAEKLIDVVFTFGEVAQAAWLPHASAYGGFWFHLEHPRAAGAPPNWNQVLLNLSQVAGLLDLTGAFQTYPLVGFANIRTAIPREDLHYGVPLWFGTSGDLSQQPSKDWVFWNAPKWVKKEPATPLSDPAP